MLVYSHSALMIKMALLSCGIVLVCGHGCLIWTTHLIQYDFKWLVVKPEKSFYRFTIIAIHGRRATNSIFKRSTCSFYQMNVVWRLRPGWSGIVQVFFITVLLCLWQELSALSLLFKLPFTNSNIQSLTFEVSNMWEKWSVLHDPYVLFSHSRCSRRGVLSLIALHATDTLGAHQCGLSFTPAPRRFPLPCVCIVRTHAAVSALHIPEPAL